MVVVRFVELGPLTVVVIVAACERTKGVPWVLYKCVPRADLRFCKNVSKGGPWVFDRLVFLHRYK